MGGFRHSGPLNQWENWIDVDDGTLIRGHSPRPGPIGTDVAAASAHPRLAASNQRASLSNYVLKDSNPLDAATAVRLFETKLTKRLLKSFHDSGHLWFEKLLDFIISDPEITDLRWVAYMLATVRHECAQKWAPIEEYGKGHGKEYGKPLKVKDASGKEHTNIYYGRGYVQLTWEGNYKRMSTLLGYGEELWLHPERVLEPEIAYKIMSYGMRHGTFTGKKLSHYIHDNACDYKNARRIINGLDQWALIKGYAEEFEAIMLSSHPSAPIWRPNKTYLV
jgi:hypothetical protein